MNKLKVSTEYGVSPLWISLENGFFDNYEPEDQLLNFSDELIKEINDWNVLYQNTFNEAYPPDSGFSGEGKKEFDELGKKIKEKMAEEVKDRFEIIWKM